MAAQYWTVQDGVGTVLKLAYDEAWKAISPGTVLSAHMIRLLLAEGVGELDYGRGDDAYKRGVDGDAAAADRGGAAEPAAAIGAGGAGAARGGASVAAGAGLTSGRPRPILCRSIRGTEPC